MGKKKYLQVFSKKYCQRKNANILIMTSKFLLMVLIKRLLVNEFEAIYKSN